jgi:hypothetical protein
MGREDLIAKIKEQNFPQGSYVVFGSGPLAAARIRDTNDIDLVVSGRLYDFLKEKGWHEKELANGIHSLEHESFEVVRTWKIGSYHPRLENLLTSAEVVNGVPFVNLQEVRIWKKVMGRPKDWRDIELIDRYMAKRGWA